MRHLRRILWLGFVAIVFVQPTLAQERRFAVRFGGMALSPTTSTPVAAGVSAELKSAFGIEANFEWYINRHLGLEASVAVASDSDIEHSDDMSKFSGITVVPATIGLNGHIIRTEQVDWYFGLVAGVIRYGDFDFESTSGTGSSTSDKIDSSAVIGAQTAVDIAFGSNDRWGINLGIKYLESELEPEDPGFPAVDVDPLIFRVLAVFRF